MFDSNYAHDDDVLLDSERQLEAPLGEVLGLVYGEVLRLLVEAGHAEHVADALCTRLVPRLEAKLAARGFISRQID